jgi:hypothetical protein
LSQESSFLKNFGESQLLQLPAQETESPVAQALERTMKTKLLLLSGVAAATVLASGWALAQTQGHSHGATVGQHTQIKGPHAKGHARHSKHQGHAQKKHPGHGKHQYRSR